MVNKRDNLAKTSVEEYPHGLVLWIILNEILFDERFQLLTQGRVIFYDRVGSNVDESNIEEALKPFNVDLRKWTNMTKAEILDALIEVKKEADNNPTKFAGLVFLFMSHGMQLRGRDYLVTSDCKMLDLANVPEQFHNFQCEGFKNRPKCFLYNMCRGKEANIEIPKKLQTSMEMDLAIELIEMDSASSNSFNTPGLAENVQEWDNITFKKADYTIVHSTVSGFVSNRHRRFGSPFIQELAAAIKENMTQDNTDYEEVIRVAILATAKHQHSGSNAPQMPEFTSTLRAKFILPARNEYKANQENETRQSRCKFQTAAMLTRLGRIIRENKLRNGIWLFITIFSLTMVAFSLVYVKINDLPFVSLDCWKDEEARAIDGDEGFLGIEGCFERAKTLGNDVFAVQSGGECFTTATAGQTYNQYGPSNGCSKAGTGGTWCQEVYKIAQAGCPNINDLPVMTEAGDAFWCIWNWSGRGGDIPLEGCNGEENSYLDGIDKDASDGHYYPFGSAIVKAGCTLYGYEGHGYTGERIDYPGPATYPDGCSGSHCPPVDWGTEANGFYSLKCRCQQDPIICTPSDKYVTIMLCDNRQSDFETLCSYTKTIGTTFTNTAQDSMSIDASIEYAMEAAFFKFFSESIGISASTGYDWTQTSSEAKSEPHSFTVRTTVPPHKMLIIEGAEGDCGGNIVQTELFIITTVDGDGNVESQYINTTTVNTENILIE